MPPPPSDIKQPDRKLKARGLTVYISDIRNCTTQEQEEERVFQELANIRAKFSQKNKHLSSYDKRKYVWKIVYTHLLGYDVDFGHMQAIELLAGSSYSEKLCGYLSLSILLKSTDDLMTLVINTIKRDLGPTSPEQFQCLALCAIANIGGREMAHALGDDVRRLALNESLSPFVRKKALLALLRIHRETPDVVSLPSELEVAQMIEPTSFAGLQLGLSLCACSLLKHLISIANEEGDEDQASEHDEESASRRLRIRQRPQVQAIVVRRFHQLAVARICSAEYYYHGTAAPFLQVALVQILRLMRYIPRASEVKEPLFEAMRNAIANVKWSKSSTINNSSRCVAFECIALIGEYGGEAKNDMVDASIELLGKFAGSKNANTRYLALGAMTSIARTVAQKHSTRTDLAQDKWAKSLGHQQDAIVASLRDVDLSVRKRAMDLLFHIATDDNASNVVEELLKHLGQCSHELPAEYKQEMVLRIAILAERFAKTPKWYVDVSVDLLEAGDEHVGDDVWHRVCQVIANQEDIQAYSALKMYKALLQPGHVPASLVRASAYVIGEFGYLLTEYSTQAAGDLDHDVLPLDLFGSCHRHFSGADTHTKIVLLTTYSKLLNIYADLEVPVEEVFEAQKTSIDCEVQQRACEYSVLARLPRVETMHSVLEPMPPWPGTSRNKLEQQLEKISSSSSSSATTSSPRVAGGKIFGKQSSSASPRLQPKSSTDASREPQNYSDTEFASPASSTNPGSASKTVFSSRDLKRKQNAPETLLDLEEDDLAAGPPPPPPQPHPSSPSSLLMAQTRKLALNALLTPKSLLYDDGKCQIGSVQTFGKGIGHIDLFIGNLSSADVLYGVYLEISDSESDELLMIVPPEVTRPNTFDVPPGSHQKFQFKFSLAKPFSTSPQAILVHSTTRHHIARFPFPVALSSFLEPFPMPGPMFQDKWAVLETSPATSAFVVLQLDRHPGGESWAEAVAKCRKLIDLVRLARVPDWPPPVWCMDGSHDLAGTAMLMFNNPSGAVAPPAGVMVRIEINDTLKSARVSVRATLPDIAGNLMSLIASQVSRLFTE